VQEYVDELLARMQVLKPEHKEPLVAAIKEAVSEKKKEIRAVRCVLGDRDRGRVVAHVCRVVASRRQLKAKAREKLNAMSPETAAAYDRLQCYKYYPQNTVPDISEYRATFVNRYYGHATKVFPEANTTEQKLYDFDDEAEGEASTSTSTSTSTTSGTEPPVVAMAEATD